MRHILLSVLVAAALVPAGPALAAPSKAQMQSAIAVMQSAADAMGESLTPRYSLAELELILSTAGYQEIRVRESGSIVFKHNDTTYLLSLYDDGDLKLYYGVGGVNLSAADINEWNSSKRLSRAYLDSDGDPVLEADLMANAGLSEKMVTEFLSVFVNASAPAFYNFLLEKK